MINNKLRCLYYTILSWYIVNLQTTVTTVKLQPDSTKIEAVCCFSSNLVMLQSFKMFFPFLSSQPTQIDATGANRVCVAVVLWQGPR